MAKYIMYQSLITKFYNPKDSLTFSVRIFTKFTITQFLWTFLVPNFKHIGQKMLHI